MKIQLKRWGVSYGFRRGLFGKNTGDVENIAFKICQLGQNDVGQIYVTARH